MLEIKPGLFLSERGPVVFLKVPAWDDGDRGIRSETELHAGLYG